MSSMFVLCLSLVTPSGYSDNDCFSSLQAIGYYSRSVITSKINSNRVNNLSLYIKKKKKKKKKAIM